MEWLQDLGNLYASDLMEEYVSDANCASHIED